MQDSSPDRLPEYLNFRAVLQARAAAQRHALHPSLRHLLEVIAGYTNGAPAWPSYDVLAGITGLSVVRVRHYAKTLVDQGYLILTRRKAVNGGWGQPEWALGHVVTGDQSPHLEVVTSDQSSGHPRPLASGHRRPQKRESSTTAAAVGESNGRGKTNKGGAEEKTEEKDPPAPQPAGNPRVAAFIDGLRQGGGKHVLEGTLTGQDFKFLKEGDFDAGDLGACYRATSDGTWPGADAWIKQRMSVANVHKYRYARWVTQGTPTAAPATNGQPSRIQAQLARIERMRTREEAHAVRGVRPALPAARDAL